jgi:hypothetical protein
MLKQVLDFTFFHLRSTLPLRYPPLSIPSIEQASKSASPLSDMRHCSISFRSASHVSKAYACLRNKWRGMRHFHRNFVDKKIVLASSILRTNACVMPNQRRCTPNSDCGSDMRCGVTYCPNAEKLCVSKCTFNGGSLDQHLTFHLNG